MYEYSPAFGSPCLPPETYSEPCSVVKLCCLAAGRLLGQQKIEPVRSHAQNLPAGDSLSTEQGQPYTETIWHPPFQRLIA